MIQINLFNSSEKNYRLPLIKAALKEFAQIKDENKSKVILVVYCHEKYQETWESLLLPVVEAGIEVSMAAMMDDTYIDKVRIAHQSDLPYTCKWDDDVFINRYVWDFMIENIQVVDQPDTAVLAPIISNGMPSVELFVEDFLTESETKYVHDIFLRDNIVRDMWLCNYEDVYTGIQNMKEWDGKEFWRLVHVNNPIKPPCPQPWYYINAKGIHPARFSYDYNMFAANHAINNQDMLMQPREYSLGKYKSPYFCNNLFMSRTEFYVTSQTIFFDHWDEGQMTTLMNARNQSPTYVRNSYGIQPAYGCTNKQREIEEYYMNNLFSKL
jgi:hypothetical protein